MRRLFCIALFLAVGALAFGQAANIPVCNGTNGPNCTDYFGVGNWANSPLPAGTITGFTLIAGGSGYLNPMVVINDPTGANATATATATAGVITGVTVGVGGSGYILPQITIVDVGTGGTLTVPTCGGATQPACGSGALATAVLGGTYFGGVRKFVNGLATLPFAVPDTTTFPGSDYYVIQLTRYKQQMHLDLPSTTLQGYMQVNNGTDATGNNTVAPPAQSYLGPIIVAQKNRPVRIVFQNRLALAPTGNLFIPVDTTYMGAGAPYAQNRATLHLHGGATPWISDGTPHQWTTPPGETGPARGDSTAFVPDMWFDASGNLIAACAGKTTCAAGATNDPGPGNMTFYWTNEQGGRLMFYHDHAYGLTRLNVYAGEAAGYLLYDPAEEAALLNATVPGTIATNPGQLAPDLSHLIPLVIQDKTFVPSKSQLDAQDPTWDGNFGATPLNTATTNGNGDLWFPHVYMPNQDPNDPIGGASGFGRWDYGPWFFPPQTSLTAGPITTTCTSSAFPGQTLNPTDCPSCGCPITPNPSGTPEAFMDTPVVNGVAYPVLHVAPAAYRFKILSAGNDRSWNLSWFVADPTQNNTEVAMLPAVPPSTGSVLPLCTAINPVAVPGLVLGLDTGLLDGLGNPLNGTGLPANCWPNYGRQPGIPAPQTMWAADGRAGGAPDPRNAGPAWVQIGSEGGLLPAPVVIPPTPVNYEQNTRSITIGSVAVHGLWLGPAERADVIVDFTNFAGKTLILYNDAPTPAPAFDSRLDYFTGDGDQSPIGGAPNTPPGYGPNTRTIMQVLVDGNSPNSQTFSLTALKNAFASTATATGIFASTQPTTIVPEAAYNSAYNATFPNTYAAIQATQLTFNPIAPLTFDNSCGVNCAVLDQKAIQELFTPDYGRMNATLGTELPNVNFKNQTTIPLGYIDPATEIIKQGNTQLWKITHNGVDTHFIHFHLFNVQVVNRVGWDGSIRPIDANEVGWKDTVRMNPLEDVLVALQPITPATPWPVPNSVRLLDVTAAPGTTAQFTNVDPFTNLPATSPNALQNFGWEYVWHCHILGHEENDMMRPIIFQVPPAAPSGLSAVNDPVVLGQVDLTFTDNSSSETGFVIQKDTTPAFSNPVTIAVGPSTPTNLAGEGTSWGGTISTTNTPGSGNFSYRVQAVDNGWATSLSQSWNFSILGSLSSGWSNIATIGTAANATVAPTSLTFALLPVSQSSLAQTVTLSNAAGAATLSITGITVTGVNAGDFSQTTSCTSSLTAGANCTISVTFTPKASGTRSATLTIASSNPTPLTVSLSGTGTAPVISPSNNAFQFGSITVGTTTTPPQVLTITNTGNATLMINGITISGGNAADFAQTNTCPIQGSGVGAGFNCTISLTFKPSAIGNRSTVLIISSNDPVTPLLNISLSGVGTQSIATLSATSLTFPTQLVNTSSAVQTVTLSNTGTVPYTINNILPAGTNAADFVLNYTCTIGGSLAPGGSCNISLTFRPTAAGTRSAAVNIATTANANPNPTITLNGTGTQVNLSSTALTFAPQVLGTTSASQQVTLTNTGPAALAVSSVALGGLLPGDFTLSHNCPASLGSGGSCRATVKFKPVAVGVRTATLVITTNDLGMPVANVALTGTGIQAAVTLTPASANFGAVTAGSTSAPFLFTLTNSGTASLTNINISLTGANANRFSQTNTCGASLAVGASCTINVTFRPQKAGTAYTATLQIRDSAPNSPQTATLTGTGQ
jgi:FtsP/CotA-like multicopper oxidase with cupredoxin domain